LNTSAQFLLEQVLEQSGALKARSAQVRIGHHRQAIRPVFAGAKKSGQAARANQMDGKKVQVL
jgi:hypothetical protein